MASYLLPVEQRLQTHRQVYRMELLMNVVTCTGLGSTDYTLGVLQILVTASRHTTAFMYFAHITSDNKDADADDGVIKEGLWAVHTEYSVS